VFLGINCQPDACYVLCHRRSPTRKKPVFISRAAHGMSGEGSDASVPSSLGSAAGWVQSVACGWGTDLVASGAGDGTLRLWQVRSICIRHLTHVLIFSLSMLLRHAAGM
jgi:WD40 repeat protein